MLSLGLHVKQVFEGSLVGKKEITFSFQVEDFWRSIRKSMRKNISNLQLLHNDEENKEGNGAILSMLYIPSQKNFHALTKLYRICYLEDRNRRF